MTRILATLLSETNMEAIVRVQYPDILVSFITLLRNKDKLHYFEKMLEFKEFIMIDSGAFSLQVKANLDMNEYVRQYANFIKRYPQIDEYVELDVESRFSLQQVEDWRKYLEDATGRQSVVVWHRPRGLDYWYKMIEQYKYVGITGLGLARKRDIEPKHRAWFVDTAHKAGAKIHGFAIVNLSDLSKIPFDSVDSRRWAVSCIYGEMLASDGSKIKILTTDMYRMKKNRIERNIESLKSLLKRREIVNTILKNRYLGGGINGI